MVKTELELRTKCRSCFSEEQQMHYLFGEFDQGLSLSDILKSTTSFVVEENDGLSPYLCENCTTIVIDFYNFKSVYEENEKYVKCLLREETFKSIIFINTQADDNHTEENEELAIVTYDEESNKHDNIDEKNIQTGPEENKDTVFNEIQKNTSLKSEFHEDKEIVIAGEFIEPQDIFEHEISVREENCSEYIAGNVEIIDSIKYSCEKCREYFLLKTGFQQHMLLKHKISIFEFDKYASKATVQIPTVSKLENEKISLQCHICREEFKTCSEIEEHYKAHKKYICEVCGAGFTKKSYLDDHAEIHTTEKRHICPICGKAFRRRTVLVKHKKIHTHPRQCVCEICGLRFNDKGTLKTHIKLKHTKERNFHCTLCGLWFPLKSTLEKHIFRHNENRSREFVCSICHMAYKDKSSLNRHTIVKHSDNAKKPSCSYCGKQYTTNTNLLKHIRKHHNSIECKNEFESD